MIKKFFINTTFILIIFLSNSLAFSQDLEVEMKIISSESSRVFIEGKFVNNNNLIEKHWSFLQSYADAENLGKRIDNLKLFSEKGNEITYKKFADGEYVAERKATSFSYTVDVNFLQNVSANAHVSWIGKSKGFLMLNDLFPTFNDQHVNTKISFQLPKDLNISTTETSINESTFSINDTENSIFLISKNYRKKEITIEDAKIDFVILDEWQFEDKLAFEMAEEITREYAELFGEIPVKNAQIILMDFPKKMERGRWRAETRGANVTILSSQSFAKSIAEQRLHEQLRHEIFHLWIPNSLNLSGDYAWFYEGFAIYQALRTGVWLGQIRFEDYLETLEQAYFLNQKRSGKNSLIDISNRRWNGEVSSVYAKGMLVAFLCDAAILEKSKGKKDVASIFRDIYRKHGKLSERKNANNSVLNVLQERSELAPIIEKYIKGTEKIDWTKYLAVFGIEDFGISANANLKLGKKLSGRQKALLKKLGYNRRRNFKRQKINKN